MATKKMGYNIIYSFCSFPVFCNGYIKFILKMRCVLVSDMTGNYNLRLNDVYSKEILAGNIH